MRETEPLEDWEPTPENMNALPEPLRRYIMLLETLCDPTGLVRENFLLKSQLPLVPGL